MVDFKIEPKQRLWFKTAVKEGASYCISNWKLLEKMNLKTNIPQKEHELKGTTLNFSKKNQLNQSEYHRRL